MVFKIGIRYHSDIVNAHLEQYPAIAVIPSAQLHGVTRINWSRKSHFDLIKALAVAVTKRLKKQVSAMTKGT